MDVRRYGVATTLYFPLIDKGFTDLESTPVTIASGDCKISKDGGAFANTTTASFTHVGGGIYSIPLTATEMQARVVVVKIVDQTGTKEWEDQVIVVTTVNHASAEVPSYWSIPQSTAAGAITNASFAAGAIDAAAIASDAIAAAKIATGAITSAKFAAGAIDASAIAADAIGSSEFSAAAAEEIAAAVWDLATAGHTTAATFGAQLKTLLDAIAGYIDTEVAAIKAKTDLLPASPADTGDIPTPNEIASELLTLDISTVEGAAAVHSLLSAILKLVSRFKAGTGETFRTDGVTVHMTQAPTVDSSADPITELAAGV